MDRVPIFRRLMLRRTPLWLGVLGVALAVAVPTGLRWVIDAGGAYGVPFITFYPSILLAALFMGWQYGAATAAVTGVVVNRVLRFEPLDLGEPGGLMVIALFALTCSILIYVAAMVRRLVHALQEAAEREALLNLELVHRVKNMLATVSSIASMTARHSQPDDFLDAFSGRIAALAGASELLEVGKEMQADLQRLVEGAIRPFRDDRNFRLSGPDYELPRDSCVPLALALHELCTNASKYGALSVEGGSVAIDWKRIGSGERLLIRWTEQGGPPVAAKRTAGMGSRLLTPQRGLGAVRLDFAETGVTCEIEIDPAQIARP